MEIVGEARSYLIPMLHQYNCLGDASKLTMRIKRLGKIGMLR